MLKQNPTWSALSHCFSNQEALTVFEPQHVQTNEMTYVPSEDTNQPVHPQSDQSLLCVECVAMGPRFLHVDSED